MLGMLDFQLEQPDYYGMDSDADSDLSAICHSRLQHSVTTLVCQEGLRFLTHVN